MFLTFVLPLISIVSRVSAKDLAKLINCPDDDILTFVPAETIYIAPEWLTEEKHLIEAYDWNYDVQFEPPEERYNIAVHIGDPEPDDKGKVLRIPKYTLVPKEYTVVVNATRKPGATMVPTTPFDEGTKTCKFRVLSYFPFAVISGGLTRYVPSGVDLVLNGNQSFDKNFGNKSYRNLRYDWTCEQKISSPVCSKSPAATGSHFVFPREYLVDGDVIKVLLNVTLDYLIKKKAFTEAVQTVFVKAQAPALEISCRKNCLSNTNLANYELTTVLVVSCHANCQGIQDDDHTWTVTQERNESFIFDYKKSRFGRTGRRFVLEKYAFTSRTYVISVEVNTSSTYSSASITITFRPPPLVTSCELIPPQGISQTTLFKISCTQRIPGLPLFYELYYQAANDPALRNLVISDFHPQIRDRTFSLPPSENKTFILTVTRFDDYPYPVRRLRISANVTSHLANMPKTIVADYFNVTYNGYRSGQSIPEMVASGDAKVRSLALQTFENMLDELIVSQFHESLAALLANLKYTVPEDMLQAPVDSLEEIAQVCEAMTKLQEYQASAESDPLLAKMASTVCKKMADRGLELILKHKTPHGLSNTAERLSKTVTRCLETNSNPNLDAVKPEELNFTTEAPTLDLPVITENYVNYVDFTDDHNTNMNNLEEATFNLINGSAVAAKMAAMTTVAGEGLVKIFGKKSRTVILKDVGSDLVHTPIELRGVKLVPSKDFENDTHLYDLIMTIWKDNIFWWNPTVTAATCIVNLEFWHSGCRKKVTNFDNPFQLFLDTTNITNVTAKIWKHSVVVPEGYATIEDQELNYHIQVYRCVLTKGPMLHIHFNHLGPTRTFKVVVTVNKFPTVEDFAKNNGTTYSFKVLNQYNYSVNVYLAVLAEKNSTIEKKMYEISSILTTCIQWRTTRRKWVPVCKPGNQSNATYIHCECTHFSLVTGYVQNVTLFRQELFRPDLVLQIVSTPVIFATVLLTLILFLILLTLSLFRQKNEIYFLADNNVNHRFVYLVIIRTGLGRKSGTTSSVIIKLTGEKNSSEPHVLNYPDPHARILQRSGKDIFILTTEHHLGSLTQIELWFDCSGPNPDWYCKEIKIYDLQQHAEWYFDVRKRISVTHGTSYIVLLTRTDRPTVSQGTKENSPIRTPKPNLKYKWEPQYHTWYLFQNEENFSYVKKLTVVLSTLLTTYTVALIQLGQPNLDLNCGLDERHSYSLSVRDVLTAFICSFPTFLVHTVIAWCFRCSQNQFLKDIQFDKCCYGCTACCWFVVLTLITSSIAFLTTFGFWVPHGTSMVWLTICGMSIAFGVIVYESIFVAIVNFFYRTEIKYDIRTRARKIQLAVKTQRRYLFLQFGELLLRPYFEHLYSPLKKNQIDRKVDVVERRHYVVTELQDLIMFAVYIVMLYTVILVNKDKSVLYGNIEMTEIIEGKHTLSIDYRRVEKAEEIYWYINETLIPSIQPRRWYGNFVISEPGLMVDVVNKYLGVVRLRQHRMTRGLCEVPQLMAFSNTTCFPEFSLVKAETRKFGYKWGKLSPFSLLDKMMKMWKYSSQEETHTFLIVGEISSYSGGGYVAYLGRTLYNSYVSLRHMVRKVWIDKATRAIFVEFLTYNANVNIFTSVRVYFEQSATGFISQKVDVSTVRMLLVQNQVEKIAMIFFFLFTIWVFFLVLKLSLGIIKHLHTFYKDTWMCIDLVITVFSVLCIVLYLVRMRLVGEYLRTMETNKKNEFHSYFHLYYIEEFLTLAAAFLVCLATVRLWKFLRFATMFRVMERTLSMAAGPLLSFTVALTVMVLGSAMTLLLLLGNDHRHFSTMMKTVRLLVTTALNPDELDVGKYIGHKLAVLYLILYMVALFVSQLIIIAMILWAYFRSELEFSTVESYTVKHYLKERLKYLTMSFKYMSKRLDAGSVKNKVEPKSDKFMYRSCYFVLSHKMRFMRFVTKCVLRNAKRTRSVLSTDDVRIMKSVSRHFLVKDNSGEIEIFYKGLIQGERPRLVNEQRIEMVANVVNLMLQEEQVDFEEEEENPELVECVGAIRKKLASLQKCNLTLRLVLCRLVAAGDKISRL